MAYNSAHQAGYKKIKISDLQLSDFFSIDGKRFFIFSSIEEIGAGLVSIHYLSTKKWMSFNRVIRKDKKVWVAPWGRHYESESSLRSPSVARG